MTSRRLLLAGSVGPERIPARPDPDDADWFLPLHVRDEHGARERLAAQVAGGADVVVAPTWLTHRRALLPLGETRRAAAWTTAAVRMAREAVEMGLERRAELLADAPDDDVRHGRPVPLLAASLPALDDTGPDVASGRILPLEAATERDYRGGAGTLTDAEPDLLLVEGQRRENDARVAISEATQTGLPVWVALTSEVLAMSSLEAWLDLARAAGVARLLLPPSADASAAADAELPWGAHAVTSEALPAWLDMGAEVIACLDGADGVTLEPLRAAIDNWERAGIEARRASEQAWSTVVVRAAALASGGAAVWIGADPGTPLPAGFDWLVVDAAESLRLPVAHYRLVVAAEPVATSLAPLLEYGGVLVGRGLALGEEGLRVIHRDRAGGQALTICRREG